MRKKLRRIIVIVGIISFLFGQSKIFAQSPYESSWSKDGVIFGIGITTGIISLVLVENVEPLTTEQVIALDRNDVNAFDRPATYNFSETADAVSDVTGIVCSLLPATLFLSKKVRNDFRTFGRHVCTNANICKCTSHNFQRYYFAYQTVRL